MFMESAETTVAVATPTTIDTLQGLGENVIYLMGFSFILGCLFTILILIMLDVMRRNKTPNAN
ncbi:MAG: hypothetical protein DI582_00580 [Azospirillum brasilense]|nr:MAG: hypothetical protein DI582_00580 [Azospirillum brasilense]